MLSLTVTPTSELISTQHEEASDELEQFATASQISIVHRWKHITTRNHDGTITVEAKERI